MANINETATWVDNIYLIDPEDPVQGGENGIDNLPHKQLAQRTLFLKNQLENLDIPTDSSGALQELNREFNNHKQQSDRFHTNISKRIDDLVIPPDLTNDLNEEARKRKEADDAIKGGADNTVTLASLMNLITKLENRPIAAIPVGGIFETTKAYKTGEELAKDLGYGTWERFAEGKATVGVSTKSSDPAWTKTINKTFGEYEHQLTVDEMPSHKHELTYSPYNTGGSINISGSPDIHGSHDNAMGNSGGDKPHNNVQPSIVVGRWVRTA